MDLFPEIFAAKRTVSTGVVDITTTPATATYAYGAVGTYVIALRNFSSNGQELAPGDTVAGSVLLRYYIGSPGTYVGALNANISTFYYTAAPSANTVSLGLTGTWKALTYTGGPSSATNTAYLALFVRIA